jgi:hypothetical protein
MTVSASQFRSIVIDPALAAPEPGGIPVSQTAADLLVATAAVETSLGTYLKQINGSARRVFQVEPTALRLTLRRRSRNQTGKSGRTSPSAVRAICG